MKKQAKQIIEFITLLEKVSRRIAAPVRRKPEGLFKPSLKSKAPAPPLPKKEESLQVKK